VSARALRWRGGVRKRASCECACRTVSYPRRLPVPISRPLHSAGDYLRLYQVMPDGDVKLDCLLNNVCGGAAAIIYSAASRIPLASIYALPATSPSPPRTATRTFARR